MYCTPTRGEIPLQATQSSWVSFLAEVHGLEILHRLELRGCGLSRLKEGSLYPALNRLESAGMVQAVWEKEPHGRRGARRRIYRLTAKGGRKLNQGRGEWQTVVETLGAILGGAKIVAAEVKQHG